MRGSLGLAFNLETFPTPIMIAWVEQAPANPEIAATAAAAVGAEVNQARREAAEDAKKPVGAPCQIVVFEAVAMATVLNAVLFQG